MNDEELYQYQQKLASGGSLSIGEQILVVRELFLTRQSEAHFQNEFALATKQAVRLKSLLDDVTRATKETDEEL